jgi:hypothetical protein
MKFYKIIIKQILLSKIKMINKTIEGRYHKTNKQKPF